MIKLENVSFSYESKNILEKCNVTIDQNKITFIIGKNGSGKSTLAGIISGYNIINSGKVIINNKNIYKKKLNRFKNNLNLIELRKLVSNVFQNPNTQIIFPRVYDDLKFTLENINYKNNIDNKINEVLKTLNIEEYKYSNPYNLSLGEKQRLTIANSLCLDSKYIIFDEPTSMLDIKGKNIIYKLIKNLKKNKGIIFITNILDELIYADDIIIVDNNKLFKYKKSDILNNLDILKEHNLDIPFKLKLIKILKDKNIKINYYSDNKLLEEINKLNV